ncbi:hypothetical protein [Paenibacillus larvae]|uniref:Uncharacterized protein n=1 Tax=Paenibacillus larvae subsp. larvae TaxID=147375 RepID=A0A2L1U7I9_9BACL|nr:hypothetical protein [Paenibacillus larvae]AVF28883.1 hypothetical protein ERICIII_04881 [Paenibacillus larvae subsp. larvae]MCY9502910.1 hypothetical protein [Paenibacillus larvae]MDR5608777.1 hypothetical protein [Paenibacillus larvae]
MEKLKVLLAPTWESAKQLTPEATVEAEYGEHVLEGSFVTLAHHTGDWAKNPAPCYTPNVPVLSAGTIVVSHIDLDTIGGIMALIGKKPEDKGFWSAAEYIDLNGPHHGYKFPDQLPKLQAYWAWNFSQPRAPRYTEVTDVTNVVLEHISTISRVISGDSKLLATGEKWASETSTKVEGCLVEENEHYRVFVTDDVFCGAAYFSPRFQKIIPTIVSMNTKFGSITISMEDGGKHASAKEIVQSLWGPEAGGHAGIAGSPRGEKMTLSDLVQAVERVGKIGRV